jgi:hypothetical protein
VTEAGTEAVASGPLLVHAEVRAVPHKLVQLLERAFIKQQMDAFAPGELAGFVLSIEARGSTRTEDRPQSCEECRERNGHRREL